MARNQAGLAARARRPAQQFRGGIRLASCLKLPGPGLTRPRCPPAGPVPLARALRRPVHGGPGPCARPGPAAASLSSVRPGRRVLKFAGAGLAGSR
jgi:hypothetical protein